ncbi:arginine methyl transferase [Panus rudis PR-1116 ss-1]|nr:arginine methyl transferase [Panus rudis PR-1116 ss-1]
MEETAMHETDVDQLVDLGESLIADILDRQPFEHIKAKIEAGAPLWFQDDEGTSALHAAAYVDNSELIQYLLEEGAIWNAVDQLRNSPGDIALSLNNEECYTKIRNAGIRSELLLSLLSSKNTPSDSPLSLVLKATDNTAAGSTETYLSSRLRYTQDENGQEICLLALENGEEVGVMMGWERDIMRQTVDKLCSDHPQRHSGLKILNVGFGLGIIDSYFQELPMKPSRHVIVEAHPDVLAHMRVTGWYDKDNVTILEGKWQDHLETLMAGGFDVVYTDTFSEDYQELKKFFELLPDLMEGPDSRFSFFNGLGATNATFYDVYTHVSELHLADVGVDVEWSDVNVFAGSHERWGKTREYFGMPIYRLPIGRMRIL